MEVGTFVLHRFNGDEIYRISKALMGAALDEDGDVALWLYADTKVKPVQTLPDTEDLRQHPNAEVYVTLKKLDASKLAGRQFSVPAAYSEAKEDHVACIYYCEHQDLNKNVVRVVEQDRNRFLVHWTAVTGDVNYYDGSERDTKVEIKAWFTFKGMRKWAGTEQSERREP
jgi:hypothetical protein